jgi:hypothetical protein
VPSRQQSTSYHNPPPINNLPPTGCCKLASETGPCQRYFLNAPTISINNGMSLNGGIQNPHFAIRFSKMKTASSERKKETEKVRKEKITFFNKAYNFSSNGINVYTVVKYNKKFFIFNSRSDKEWSFSEIMLISDIIFVLFLAKNILTA